jgi:hypothetical protein
MNGGTRVVPKRIRIILYWNGIGGECSTRIRERNRQKTLILTLERKRSFGRFLLGSDDKFRVDLQAMHCTATFIGG